MWVLLFKLTWILELDDDCYFFLSFEYCWFLHKKLKMAELENVLIDYEKLKKTEYISKSNWPIFERRNILEKDNFEKWKSRCVVV